MGGAGRRTPPVFAVFVRRLNRFVAEVAIGGEPELVHVPNTGRMKELLVPGAPAVLRKAATTVPEGRKTRYDLWAVKTGGVWVCVDSRAANDVAAGLFEASLKGGAPPDRGLRQTLSPLVRGITGLRREARAGPHRFDFALLKGDAQALVEVKSVNLVEDGVAKFPDAPTVRGAGHLRHLSRRAQAGEEAYVLFVVQRSDGRLFRPYWEVDPAFAEALVEAAQSGVGVVAVGCEVSPAGIRAAKSLPVELSDAAGGRESPRGRPAGGERP